MLKKLLLAVGLIALFSPVLAKDPNIVELEQRIANNDREAMIELAQIYFNENKTANDRINAVFLLREAEKLGSKKAAKILANIHTTIYSLDQKTIDTLQQKAANGHTDAMTTLAIFYIDGKNGLPKDPEKGIALLEKAIAANNLNAQVALAIVYLTGKKGIAQNVEKGEKLVKEAAEKGNFAAQKLLSCLESKKCQKEPPIK